MAFAGSLIFPEIAVLRFLDANTMRAAGDYDDIFREPEIPDTDADGIGEPVRTESAEIKVPAQVATRTHERIEQLEHGQVPVTGNLELTFHLRDLNRLGLVETDSRPKIQPGTRLARIENKAGKTLFDYPDPPGMFVTATRHSGHMGGQPNLWVVTFSDRREAVGEPRPQQN